IEAVHSNEMQLPVRRFELSVHGEERQDVWITVLIENAAETGRVVDIDDSRFRLRPAIRAAEITELRELVAVERGTRAAVGEPPVVVEHAELLENRFLLLVVRGHLPLFTPCALSGVEHGFRNAAGRCGDALNPGTKLLHVDLPSGATLRLVAQCLEQVVSDDLG